MRSQTDDAERIIFEPMDDIEKILADYQSLHLNEVIDHDRFNQYSIVHHSSTIEGSTLTENETRVLLEEGITPNGKPLEHSLMVKHHYDALLFTLAAANKKQALNAVFVQAINAQVMRHTGKVYNTVFGEIDASKGMWRKGNVSAGGSYFVGYDKVESYTKSLCEKLTAALNTASTIQEQLQLSFSAHFDLVSIHPFYDGNGRTSRLLMNYIQAYFQLPLALVFKEDKAAYYTALQDTRKTEDIEVFYNFMFSQYQKFLEEEIAQFRKDISPKGKDFSFFF